MPHHADGRPKYYDKKADKHSDQGQDPRSEFVQAASKNEEDRHRYEPDEQRKFSTDRDPKWLGVFRLLNCIRFCRHGPEHIGWA